MCSSDLWLPLAIGCIDRSVAREHRRERQAGKAHPHIGKEGPSLNLPTLAPMLTGTITHSSLFQEKVF